MFATSPRDIYTQKKSCPNVNLGTLIPAQTVIFVLGLEYGVISPLILPFVCLFFILQYFVYLYQFLYVYEIPFETAGRAFPRAIRHIYIGLFISQITLIGLFGIRSGGKGQMALMIVTLIFTAFALYYYDRAFKPLFKYLPVSIFEDEHFMTNKKTDAITQDDPVLEVHDDDKHVRAGYVSDDSEDSGKASSQSIHKPIISKKATNSTEHSPTSIEAYNARSELRQRLRDDQGKSPELLKNDQQRILATAKSLYSAEAYMHPSTYLANPTIWIPDDDLGIAQKELKELKSFDIDGSCRDATVVRNDKGKGKVSINEERLIVEQHDVPGGSPAPATGSSVNDYVRVVVDSYNFGDAITMF
jgi:hypothetical protein